MTIYIYVVRPFTSSFSNPFKNFKNMSHREIMIATGQISGDEPSKDDQEFNIALTLVGKNAWRLVDRVLLDF